MKWSIDGDFDQMPGKARLRDATALEAKLLDDVNLRLLEELSRDGRVGMAELGRRLGMSAPAVAERVQRLERAGVITGYRAEVDPGAVGFPISAIVRIRPAPGQLQRIPEIARETPEVAECYRITGEDCYLLDLRLRARDRATPPNQVDRSIARVVVAGTTFLAGDLTQDGRVDGADLVRLALHFGARNGEQRFLTAADLNGDRVVDGMDLAALAANFGRSSF